LATLLSLLPTLCPKIVLLVEIELSDPLLLPLRRWRPKDTLELSAKWVTTIIRRTLSRGGTARAIVPDL
jgi:hypothetical protein